MMSTPVGLMPQPQDAHEAWRMLQDGLLKHQEINQSLYGIISEQADLHGKLMAFHTSIPASLGGLGGAAGGLQGTVSLTEALAHRVSSKVRDLDSLRARVKETSKKVEDIIDLKNCADIVKKAMAAEDYEIAAEHIQKYNGFTNGIGALEPMSREGPTHEVIASAELQLKNLIRSKLDQSLAQENQDEIMRFCELYAKLGMKDEGLTRYCHYLRKTCSNNAEKIVKQYLYGSGRITAGPAPTAPPLTAPASLAKIFESVALIVEEQVPIVNEHFGDGSAVTMIRNMVEQCNTHTNRIVELFMENHSVARKMDFLTDKVRISEKERDPRVLTATLDELVSICKSAEFYMRFISKKIKALTPETSVTTASPTSTSATITATTNQKKTTVDATSINNELSRKLQELVGYYIPLEEYFMVESVQKAIKMDEQSGDSLTSSMVDYVFFVLQQSSQRAVESHNIYGLCATINHIVKCLDINYKEVLIKFFKEQAAKALQGRAEHKNAHLVALNNLDVSSDYIMRLKSEIEANTISVSNSSGERGMFSRPEDQEKVKTALGDLYEISKRFKQTLEYNMEQFCLSIQPRTRLLVELFVNSNYEVSEQEYANNEINDPFAQLFIAEATSILKPFSTHLTPANYDLFVRLLVNFIVKKLEKALLQKRVNQLGALQFSRDLMTLSSHFSSLTRISVRDKFARLSQMANLLCSENLSEVAEMWSEASDITWRLTPTEARKVLMLRVDYSSDLIAKLKL